MEPEIRREEYSSYASETYLPPEIRWESPEYHHFERSGDWYWSLWIITIALAVAAVIFNNTLLAILVILGAFSFSLFSKRRPKMVEHLINEKGVWLKKLLYPYSTIESFWLEEIEGARTKLILKSKRKLSPFLIFPIGNTDPELIRAYLSHYLREEEHEEPLLFKVMEYLGF